MSLQFCKRTCRVLERFFDDKSGLQSGNNFDRIVDRVSLSASRRLRKCKLTISLSFECDTSCSKHGVTFTQNSNRIEVATVSLAKTETCSK